MESIEYIYNSVNLHMDTQNRKFILEAMGKAMNKLSKDAYALWTFFIFQETDKVSHYETYELYKKCGISRPSYFSAVRELINKGYAVRTENKDIYIILLTPNK